MAKVPAVMGVHILDPARGPTRVGSLTRDSDGGVAFIVSETYLRDPERPILSLGWSDPTIVLGGAFAHSGTVLGRVCKTISRRRSLRVRMRSSQ
jgi:hypothetical protein